MPGSRRPLEDLAHESSVVWVLKILEEMSDRAVEDPTLAPCLCPCHRHSVAVDPRKVVPTKNGLGEHMVVRVALHVVLLCRDAKVANALGDLVLGIDNRHVIWDASGLASRMLNE